MKHITLIAASSGIHMLLGLELAQFDSAPAIAGVILLSQSIVAAGVLFIKRVMDRREKLDEVERMERVAATAASAAVLAAFLATKKLEEKQENKGVQP